MPKVLFFLKKHWIDLVFIALLVGSALPLRFSALGYSDYIGDEHKAFLQPRGQTTWEFLMSRRKGPMQFFVSYIPYVFIGTFRNELAIRFPFALCSVAAVIVFYLLIRKLTGNKVTGFIAAFLLMVNGLIVGFGRIAQYQNLNLLFSFLSLYFYADLLRPPAKALRSGLLGTLFFSLSLLSHWDAIFILPLASYFLVNYLFSHQVSEPEKRKLILANLALGIVLLLPFLIPYLRSQADLETNQIYLATRIGLDKFNVTDFVTIFRMYNPFVTLEFLVIAASIGVLVYKRSWSFTLWFLTDFAFFVFFFIKPGTHIYNFVIPVIALAAIGLSFLLEIKPRFLAIIPGAVLLAFFGFFYYQSDHFFIDHSPEYPWTQKTLFTADIQTKICRLREIPRARCAETNPLTPRYSFEQKLPYFGFPHRRDWDQISEFIDEQNRINGTADGYVTNEEKTVSEWYVNAEYGFKGSYYLVGVKIPTNFSKDYTFPQYGKKELVKSIYVNGVEVVKIFRRVLPKTLN